ncbi:probable proline--tRNA ligase, mitochondrial [Toxorhynchites rutilus septentrionalis]|uniref:probable proline--tRNA ligase, mitochondrial n=1 Tax=Toxorhynchites rutilus septentrionalis TaxID=329112 RepID=UPI00247A5CBA|nr:probable proline--tRNA ligase, mitochondrial [Toxorhynchites rutilus septentrionalis]XP_055641308.1 probable proline--tRNA ligase, mitochondrial [Toxorhynchites rutilus septentrionalis]XP_055641309.1 probable proline--tRNA ligase, mitochondrial [Toxorhynchites rutilus septentrionalis]
MFKLSKIFQPSLVVPKNAVIKNQDVTSKSQKLMLEQGLIRQAGNGTFYLLPLLQRSLQKAVELVDLYMQRYVDAEKLTLPILTSADLWHKSGRLESAGAELMQTTDRHGKRQILGPTHEESITALLAAVSPVSYRQCPLRLYQISSKFRDELRPRFGLMRSKEFVMKDLYTFDVGLAEARRTYEEVGEAYVKLFEAIGVPYVKVSGDSGVMGGSVSHEYHFLSEVGEDQLICCDTCGMRCNQELFQGDNKCDRCGHENIVRHSGIEVAHAFILEDKYSKVLGAKFMKPHGKPGTLQMGCYGVGITRLIAAGVEVLSSEKDIRWPFALAPFKVCLIPPKSGSKEEALVAHWAEKLISELGRLPDLRSDILIDDRTNTTIGKRLMEAKKTGYPITIVIGPKASEEGNELFEIHNQMDEKMSLLNFSDTLTEIKRICDKYVQ